MNHKHKHKHNHKHTTYSIILAYRGIRRVIRLIRSPGLVPIHDCGDHVASVHRAYWLRWGSDVFAVPTQSVHHDDATCGVPEQEYGRVWTVACIVLDVADVAWASFWDWSRSHVVVDRARVATRAGRFVSCVVECLTSIVGVFVIRDILLVFDLVDECLA